MATLRKRNNKWQVQIRIKGYKPMSKSFSTKALANTWAKTIESKMERGIFVDMAPARGVLLEDIFDRYLQEYAPKMRSTKTIGYVINRHLKAAFGCISLAGLTREVIVQYRDRRLKLVCADTVIKELSILSRVIVVARNDWGYALPHGNPCEYVTRPRRGLSRTRRLLPQEEQKLLAYTQTHYPQMNNLIRFAIETGMRKGEILNMTTADINWKKATLHIPVTKTNLPRTIPLSSTSLNILKDQLALRAIERINYPVFQFKTHNCVSKHFKSLADRLGLNDLRLHDLRHEATSRLFEKGLSPMEVASITGHRDLRMLMRYTHLKPESLVAKLG